MRKYLKPAVAVAAGIATSLGLQEFGMAPMAAKIAGLAVVALVLAIFWRRSAAL